MTSIHEILPRSASVRRDGHWQELNAGQMPFVKATSSLISAAAIATLISTAYFEVKFIRGDYNESPPYSMAISSDNMR